MKFLITVFLAIFTNAACAALTTGISPHNHSNSANGGTNITGSTIQVAAPITSTAACLDNQFVRYGVDKCWYRSTRIAGSGTITYDDVTCNSITLRTFNGAVLPNTVTSAMIQISFVMRAVNAIGQANVHINLSTDATCTNLAPVLGSHTYEYVATLANTIIGIDEIYVIAPVINNKIYFTALGTTGSTASAFNIVFYYD